MKTKNYLKKSAAFIIAATFAFCQANGQTSALSGTAAASNTCSAGTAGTDNTNVGCGAGTSIVAGANQNTLVGKSAGTSINNTAGDDNTCVGFEAGKTTTSGSRNAFLGSGAGATNGTHVRNTFVGYQTGNANTSDSVTAVGYQALKTNTIGAFNVAVGYQALFTGNASDFGENTACGFQALYSSQKYGGSAFGFWAARNATTGCGLSAFGEEALRDNTTGGYNTGVGVAALHLNQTGSYNTCVGHNAGAGIAGTGGNHSNNSFLGAWSGQSITTGYDNVFVGYKSGNANTTGYYNTCVGDSAGAKNTTGHHNAFLGYSAGASNTTGDNNAAFGNSALITNTTGQYNTAVGNYAMRFADTGIRNTACGYTALYNNTGSYNTAIGYGAGTTNTTGYQNSSLGGSAGANRASDTACTFLGYAADASANYYNATALGTTALVNARNKVRLGNTSVTVIEGTPAMYTSSDGRFKTNVKEEVKGLEFINRLRPVVYNLETQKFEQFLTKNMPDSLREKHFKGIDFASSTAIRRSGFIAQEVEKAAVAAGYNFDGVHKPNDENDNYSLAYGEFVVPLVKAVQELSTQVDSLKAAAKKQEAVNQSLQSQIDKLTESKVTPTNTTTSGSTSLNVNLKDGQSVVLEQNVPNPFAEQTSIGYFLPENVNKAQMLFYNSDGKLIQSVPLNEKGKGSLNVFASDLTNGTYTYSLVVDGRIIETKKMMKQQ